MIRFGSCKVPRMNQALSILTGVRIGELMLEKIYGLFVGTDTTVRTAARVEGGGGGVLPIMAYTGRLRLKGVPFSRFRYMKG